MDPLARSISRDGSPRGFRRDPCGRLGGCFHTVSFCTHCRVSWGKTHACNIAGCGHARPWVPPSERWDDSTRYKPLTTSLARPDRQVINHRQASQTWAW